MPPTKRTPAKASPRKTAVEKIDKFESLRARARASEFEISSGREPLVLDAFDPPITATYPSSLESRLALDEATREMRLVAILRIFLGGDQFIRAVREFDKLPDSDALLLGLVLKLIDHFVGPGAGDVPGGSPAS